MPRSHSHARSLLLLFCLVITSTVTSFSGHPRIPLRDRQILAPNLPLRATVSNEGASQAYNHQNSNDSTAHQQQEEEDPSSSHEIPQPTPQRTYCITGVAPRTGPLNEAVARIANLDSLEEANQLIDIGAVWARMDALSEDDVLSQYDTSDFESNARALYADLDNRRQGTYEDKYGPSNIDDESDLEAYIEQMQNQRFRRVLTPVFIESGTDLRIYPSPRRFPACDEFARPSTDDTPNRLLYEDTTFIVVDKPPMLPTQPDASNYYECCPGCVQTHMGPFEDIAGNTISRPLLCHRVDACVGGCVVMSKDQNGQKVFQEFQVRPISTLYIFGFASILVCLLNCMLNISRWKTL